MLSTSGSSEDDSGAFVVSGDVVHQVSPVDCPGGNQFANKFGSNEH